MTDQPQAQQNPDGMTPEAPMPSAPQTSSDTQADQAAPSQEVPSQQQTSEGLPEDAKERTRHEFEKLQSQLREERAKREYAESVFQRLNPPPVIEQPKPVPLVDPTTGLLNESALSEMQRQTQQATQKAQYAEENLRNYQLNQERKEAYGAHPELNPQGSTFDPEFSREVRKVIQDNMMYPKDYDDKQFSFKEAADVVKERFKPMIDKAQQQGAQQAIEQITPKEQAALEVTGSPLGKSEINAEENEQLRIATRKGGETAEEAIVRRMRGLTSE